jgi:glyoxylate/hydroxypyruvate reductase
VLRAPPCWVPSSYVTMGNCPGLEARVTVVVATYLEPEHVERMRAMAPDRVEVVYEPALLPRPRYVADHHGEAPSLDAAGVERWRSLVAGADVLFDFDWMDPATLPRRAPRLRWVQATSSGIGDFLRRTGLEGSGIEFTTAAGVHAGPLAEFVLLSLLYFAKDVPMLLSRARKRVWRRHTSGELAGDRVLVVGLGATGSAIAARCAANGLEVWGMRRGRGPAAPPGVSRLVDDLGVALPEVDALVLACPLTAETHHLLGAHELGVMRSSAVLVNVSRGAVVDEGALVDALRRGRLRGAALDVVEEEPLPASSPLWSMPHVLLSPHSASTVPAENDRILDIFEDNLRRFLSGRPLRNRYGADRGY